tara:strand:+ start:234 stop:431 length:198 start_codon:yes stop_codon:yes gene_type:complete
VLARPKLPEERKLGILEFDRNRIDSVEARSAEIALAGSDAFHESLQAQVGQRVGEKMGPYLLDGI